LQEGFIETLEGRLRKGLSFSKEIPEDMAGADDLDH